MAPRLQRFQLEQNQLLVQALEKIAEADVV
jgi:hypothetical protein